ncbi:major facilitator superfamily domain-containing protein 4A-like isoform X4 [Nelusetta ayraudi]|uniref:major facilitator superfamily domain-containing protein 4A-like isoform X4 n=1 Tax=Nelusetta ayraudi TaxID=303726 RepID=UPI003F722C38
MKLLDDHIVLLLRRNLQPTLTYWAAFFSFGLCMSFLGPTILDLRCQTRSSLDQITWVFFSQQLFLLVGSCLGGLFKKTLCSSLSALFSSTLIISLMFAAIPLCGNVVLLSVAVAVVGCAMGVIDTIANLQLVNLYHRDSAVFLQALHFFIGVGALISPLVVDPFLDENNCTLSAGWSSSSPSDPDSELFGSNSSDITASPDNYQYSDYITDELLITRVSYAFWIMALINLPVPAAVLALMYNQRLLPCFSHSPRLLDSSAQRGHPVDNHGVGSLFACCNPNNLRGRPATFFILHALGGAILFITDGIIGSYAGFVYIYAVSPPVLMANKVAGGLSSAFWASVTMGRLIFICVSIRYTAPKLLTFSLMGVVVVQLLLLIFYESPAFLFIGTCLVGLCISSVFPSLLAFTEDILNYKGCATTVLVASASTGEMVLQLLVGYLIHNHGSYTFLLSCTISLFIGLCLFLLFLYVQHFHNNVGSSKNIPLEGMATTGKP